MDSIPYTYLCQEAVVLPVFHTDDKAIILIVCASGLSSAESMIIDLLNDGDKRQITLFQGARNVAELYHWEFFKELADRHSNCVYLPALNEPEENVNWQGFVGFFHEAAIAHRGGMFSDQKAYLCGPPPMIDAAIGALVLGHLFGNDIHLEKFTTAADGPSNTERSALFKRI